MSINTTSREIKAPDWILKQEGITQRGWRKRKRREMREVIKALNTFLKGAAHTPSPDDVYVGIMLLEAEKYLRALSVKNWGR